MAKRLLFLCIIQHTRAIRAKFPSGPPTFRGRGSVFKEKKRWKKDGERERKREREQVVMERKKGGKRRGAANMALTTRVQPHT